MAKNRLQGCEVVERAIWRNPKFRELGPDARLTFLWIITNDHTGASGVFPINPKRGALETGLGASRFGKAWAELTRSPHVRVDDQLDVAWVVKRMERTCISPNHWIGCRRHLERFTDCDWFPELVMMYPALEIAPEEGAAEAPTGAPPEGDTEGDTEAPIVRKSDSPVVRQSDSPPHTIPSSGARTAPKAEGPPAGGGEAVESEVVKTAGRKRVLRVPTGFYEWVRLEWNRRCAAFGMIERKVKLTAKLKAAVHDRWKECEDRAAWEGAFLACSQDEWWLGQNDRNWTGSIESFLREKHFDRFVNEGAGARTRRSIELDKSGTREDRIEGLVDDYVIDPDLALPSGFAGGHPGSLAREGKIKEAEAAKVALRKYMMDDWRFE